MSQFLCRGNLSLRERLGGLLLEAVLLVRISGPEIERGQLHQYSLLCFRKLQIRLGGDYDEVSASPAPGLGCWEALTPFFSIAYLLPTLTLYSKLQDGKCLTYIGTEGPSMRQGG